MSLKKKLATFAKVTKSWNCSRIFSQKQTYEKKTKNAYVTKLVSLETLKDGGHKCI